MKYYVNWQMWKKIFTRFFQGSLKMNQQKGAHIFNSIYLANYQLTRNIQYQGKLINNLIIDAKILPQEIQKSKRLLRGGGCFSSHSRERDAILDQQLKENELEQTLSENILDILYLKAQMIYKYATTTGNVQRKEEILLCFQYFLDFRDQLHFLSENQNMQKFYEVVLQTIQLILKSCIIFAKTSFILLYYGLIICSCLTKFIFNFYKNDQKRLMSKNEKQQLSDLINSLENSIQGESQNLLFTGINFYFQIIQASIEIIPTNENKKLEIFKLFASGLVQSVSNLQPSKDLIQSFILMSKFFYYKFDENKKEELFKNYYNFECSKWEIIFYLLKLKGNVPDIINMLDQFYTKEILNSNSWQIHFLWISLLCDILKYRPILNKQYFLKLTKSVSWENFIRICKLKQLPYNPNLIKLSFDLDFSQLPDELAQNFQLCQGFESFREFSNILISNNKKKKFLGLDSYVNFTLKYDLKLMFQVDLQIREVCSLLFNNKNKIIQDQMIKLKNNNLKLEHLLKSSDIIILNVQDLKKQQINLIVEVQTYYQKFIQQIHQILLGILCIYIQTQKQLCLIQIAQLQLSKFIDNDFNNQIDIISEIKPSTFEDQFCLQFIEILKQLENKTQNQFGTEYQNIIVDQQPKIKGFCQYINEQIIILKSILKNGYIANYTKEQFLQIQIDYEQEQDQRFYITFPIDMKQIFLPVSVIATIQFHLIEQVNLELKQLILSTNTNYIYLDETQFLIKISIHVLTLQSHFELLNHLQNLLIKEFKQLEIVFKKIFQFQLAQQIKDQQNREKLILCLETLKEFLFFIINILERQSKQQDQQNKQKYSEDYEDDQSYEYEFNEQLKRFNEFNQFIQIQHQNSTDTQQLRFIFSSIKEMEEEIKCTILLGISKIYIQNDYQRAKIQEYLIILQNVEKNFKNIVIDHNLEDAKNEIDIFQIMMNRVLIIQENILQGQVIINQQLKNLQHAQNLSKIQSCQKQNLQLIIQQIKKKLEDLPINLIFNQINDLNIDEIVNRLNKINYSFKSSNIFLKFFHKEILNDDILNIEHQDSSSNEEIREKISSYKNYINNNEYRIREYLAFSLMEIVNFSSEKTIQNYSSSLILEIWGLEKDSRVRFLLKDQEIIEIQKKIFSKDLQSMNENLKQNVQKRMKFIEELEFQVKQTEDEDIRNQKMQQIQQEYQEFQEYLANLHEMEQQLNITLYFLIDIKKDIRGLKFKLESLEQNLENIKRDVTQLKGKSFRELFEVRKQNVLQNKKKLELTKVFVPIYCKTKQDNQIILLLDNEKMNKKAAINLFLLKESILYHNSQVDVLVIYGQTGSGKSTIARKIEEFLWEQYDSQQSKYIPIFINLPNIQDPRQGIINQILESEQYLFDKIQVRQLAEEVDQNKLTLVLIMDGYDEMKSQYQHLNLYTLNQISTQWKRSKVIFTTRYSVQFQFKHQIQEAEICSFTNDQQNQYIQLYVVLQFKSTLLKFYQNCLRYIQRVFCHQEFSQLWNQIQELIIFNKRNIFTETDQFLDSNELYQLSFFLNQLYPNKIKEQTYADLIYHLNEECQQIWSAKKYSDIINQLNLRNILQMPFMLQIVLKVLPEIPNMCSDLKLLKNIFVQNYVKFKERKHLIKKFSKSKKGIIQEFNKQIEVRNVQNYWEILLEKEVFKNYSFLNNIKLNNNLLIINNYSFNFGEECEIIKEALINQDFSTYQFYTFFVDWYHQEQIQKIQNNQINIDKEIFITDLNNFSYQLALEMTEHDLTVLNYSKKGLMNFGIDNEFPESWADKYFCQKDIENEYLCLLRKCSLLNQKGNQYSFLHKSIQEFYVSKKIVDFIDLLENFNLEQLNSQVTNYQIQDEKILKNDPNIKKFINIIQTNKFSQLNLSQQSFRGMIPFLKAQKARIKQFKLALLVIIKLSKLFDNFEQAAGNSLLILNQIGILFNQENFSYIRVKNTDLSGASFYKTNLLNSKMEQIVISQCNFNKALLKNCEWKQVYCNELTSLYGHKRAVNSIAFSPNGQILGSASDDKSIIIWNTNNWKEKLRLLGHKDKIKQLMFSPIEELLVSCSRDKSVIIWNIQNNKQVYKFKGHKKSVNWVVFSPNGQFIASASTREFILLWNRRNGNILVTIDQYQKCKTSIIFSLDGSLLIFGNNENSIKIWNIETGQEQSQLKGHDGKITSLSIALYRDKEIIASASLDSTIRLWDMKIGTEITCFKSQSLIKFITFSSDGQILAYINENHSINLLNVSTKEIIEKLVGHSNVLNSLSFSPNGQILASSSSDGSIVLWNLQEIKQFQNRQGHLKSIKSIAFSPDGCIVASSSEDRYILLWDIKTGSQIYKLQTHQKVVNCLVFSPDGEILASGSKDKSIVIWNVKIWKEIQIFKGHNDQVLSLAFSNNGILLASGSSDKTIKIWNRKGEEICILEGHNDEVTSLCFSIDDILLLSCSFDKNIIFWDINTGQQIQNIYMHNKNIKSLTISPDGLLLASAGIDKQICIWNIQTGIQIQLFEKHHELINQIAFSPDGKTLASCSLDKQIILWDITTGCIIETLKENSNSVTTLAFSPDGEILVSGTSDSQIRFWDIKLINKVTNIESLIDKNNCKLQINSLAFSPDGLILASGDSNKQISIWDIQTGKLIFQREKHYNYITSVCFSPVDNILASASYDQSIKFWDYKKGELIKTINSKIGTIYYITFAPDGKSIAALTKFQVIIWDINQSKQIIKYKLESKKALISFSPNGQQLAIAQKKIQIIILDINKQNCDIHLVGHNRSITSIQFSKNQNLLISGSKDKRLFLWNLNSKNKTLFLGHKQKIACVQFSHDDSIITSVSYNSEIIFWETATALILKIVQGYINFGNTIAISPNGQILASADIGQHINLWDLNSEQKILEFQKIQSNALLAVTFDKNYQFLAFACKDYSISIWNLKNNQEIQQLKNINELVLSIMLSQNGMLLAISCIKQLKIYQIDKGLKIFEIEIQNELVNQILFSPNEQKLIIINNNNSIQYWDLFEKYLIFQIESFNSMIKSIEFSQDGFILGVRNIQNTIRFWNLQTCQENFTFDVNNCQLLTSTLFSDDGSLLAIPDNDNYIRILDLTTNSVIQTIQMENFNCLQSIFKQKSNLQKSQQLLQKKDQTDQYHHYQRICQSSCYKIIGISCPMAANFADITNSQIWSKEEQNLIPLLLQKGSFQHNLSIK